MLLKSDSIEKIHTYRISPDIPKVLQLDETNDAVNVQSNNKVYNIYTVREVNNNKCIIREVNKPIYNNKYMQ